MIANLRDLVIEATRRSRIEALPERAEHLIGLAEADLSARLRVEGMITQAQVTSDAQGVATLPDDFREISYVKVANNDLIRRPPSQVTAGRGDSYAIIWPKLRSSYADTDHDCSYFAALPSLWTEENNWMLALNPGLYLHALLSEAYLDVSDLPGYTAAATKVNELIYDANNRYKAKVLADSRVVFHGVAP